MEKLEKVIFLADEYFERISLEKLNSEILTEIIKIPDLTKKVVEGLDREEKLWNWPLKDKDIRNNIKSKCREYNLVMPKEEKSLDRWYSLIYLCSSLVEDFSYGNLIESKDIIGY